MSKIFDLGRTPEEWSARLRPRGVELSPRTLRSKAREHGQYFAVGRAIFITPDQMDEILLREADRTSRSAELQHGNAQKGG
ncbi:hypothetical protein LO749_17200 [Paracoccus denitrificans]|uniref:hypothetical protein n=1 Tax=Paracoccus denitrificans TaxID=266 RepID=UPI001E3CE268|nr:hypothetical protein [Paracoccus denitrificans]UFS66262.1 hypothetical protein LO749_17200 [Paracoccus denitrificans]